MNSDSTVMAAAGETRHAGVTASPAAVTVVVLSYARPHLLEASLDSIVRQSYSPLEILVVDNRSDLSPQVAAIVERYPSVRLVANRENLGFTGGMNAGLRAATGKYVLLTEDDMVLDTNCVRELVTYAGGREKGLYSGVIYSRADGSVWVAGGKVDLASTFRLTLPGRGEPNRGQFPTPFDTEYISGAMIFGEAKLLKELGGFREQFFMYCEDVDLCLRARKQGCALVVVPSAHASHFDPLPGRSADIVEVHKLKNTIALYILHAPWAVLIGFLLKFVVLGLVRLSVRDRHARSLLIQALREVRHMAPSLWHNRRMANRNASTFRNAVRGKYHALQTIFRMWRYLENWREVWTAYRHQSPLPTLKFRRGFRLYHSELDCPISLLHEIFGERLYERALQSRNPGLIIDIGANIGAVVLDFATRWRQVEIHAYEPNPATRETLERNARENAIGNRVTVFEEAVSGNCGETQFWVNMLSVGANAYAEEAPQEGAVKITVPTVGLDRVVERTGGRDVAFLKIDAEGAEADILENAAPGCFQNVRQVAVEYHEMLCPNALSRCRALLEQRGYQVAVRPDPDHPGIGMLYGSRS